MKPDYDICNTYCIPVSKNIFVAFGSTISDCVTSRFGNVMCLSYWVAEGAQNSHFTQHV